MISVILYGRNDAHGYNLHRRAALSLNCIAEVLTDPDDELIFVDYNTPDELPTFVEAIADTLTERCLDVLRVLRVRAETHEQRFAARTHLRAVEPVARNVAARRANPANRWLLSTNTDMIFVPLGDQSMGEICRDLTDGFYGLPRFELPEWLWEWLPRSDPRRALTEIGRLGPRIGLDEPTLSFEWIRFDAPGDFQLILRDDFVAIDGFDEEMLLGYHVDSNMSRRLLLHRGSIESLEQQLSGYHCNHNRTRTVYHGPPVTNDLLRFLYSVDDAALPAQRSTWGLPDVKVEEVSIRHGASARCSAVLSDVIPRASRVVSDGLEAPHSLTYDSGHVLPHVVDTLVVSSLDARIGYVGANPILERMLRAAVNRLGFEQALASARFEDLEAVEQIARSVDIFIIDLGVDVTQGDVSDNTAGETNAGSDLPKPAGVLGYAARALNRLIEIERTRSEEVKHRRPMTLVNSSMGMYDAYVLAQLDCSHTSHHSRVRRATVKPADQVDSVALARVYRLERWSTRRANGARLSPLRMGERVNIADLEDYGGFGPGWSPPEDGGIWTVGPRSELRIAVDEIGTGDYELALTIVAICIARDDLLRVTLLANGEPVDTREFAYTLAFPWRIELPARVWAPEIELTFRVDEPRSPLALGWSIDERLLGIHIGTLAVEPVDRRVAAGEHVLFSTGSGGERLLAGGWSAPEATGVWTDGRHAHLDLRLSGSASAGVDLVLDVVPFLTPEHNWLEVEVWTRDERVAAQTYRHGAPVRALEVHLPDAAIDAERRVLLDLRLRDPVRPIDLGLSADPRRLGLHLRSLAIQVPPERRRRRWRNNRRGRGSRASST
jgi:hypothetical protein